MHQGHSFGTRIRTCIRACLGILSRAPGELGLVGDSQSYVASLYSKYAVFLAMNLIGNLYLNLHKYETRILVVVVSWNYRESY